jgi:hypothetical protein
MTNPSLHIALVRAQRAEIERRAAERGPLLAAIDAAARAATEHPVTMRVAAGSETEAVLARLPAAAGSALSAPLLLGEIDGELVAALSLSDGSIVANPRSGSPDIVALLQLRAGQLGVQTASAPRRRLRRLAARFG